MIFISSTHSTGRWNTISFCFGYIMNLIFFQKLTCYLTFPIWILYRSNLVNKTVVAKNNLDIFSVYSSIAISCKKMKMVNEDFFFFDSPKENKNTRK